MKNQKRNISMISNSESQIKTAADACGVHKWQVMKAKEDLNTNDRKAIYDHLNAVKSLEAAATKLDPNKTPLTFVIEFGGHVRAQVVINNNTPEVTMCVDGYGNRLPVADVTIKDVTGAQS